MVKDGLVGPNQGYTYCLALVVHDGAGTLTDGPTVGWMVALFQQEPPALGKPWKFLTLFVLTFSAAVEVIAAAPWSSGINLHIVASVSQLRFRHKIIFWIHSALQ
jgi:hypothetical protein